MCPMFTNVQMKSSMVVKELYAGFVPAKQAVPWADQVWNKFSLPRTAFLHWLIMWQRLPTKARLHKFGLIDCNLCVFCKLAPETHGHLLCSCSVLKLIMQEFLKVMGLRMYCSTLNQWIVEFDKSSRKKNIIATFHTNYTFYH